MHILLIHQAGLQYSQFRHLAPVLAQRGHHVTFLQEARNGKQPGHLDRTRFQASKGVLDCRYYARPADINVDALPTLLFIGQMLARAEVCLAGVKAMRRLPFGAPTRLDLVLAHCGWGDSLLLRDELPDSRLLCYSEFFGKDPVAAFDPEYSQGAFQRRAIHARTALELQSLYDSDQIITPTFWQRSIHPPELHSKIQVIHEGIDTSAVQPDSNVSVSLNGYVVRPGDEVVTYVARNLEPYRGLHTMMRSLPLLQKLRPRAQVIVVGGAGISYSNPCPGGISYLEHYRRELGDRVDWSRVHFTGTLAREDYLKVLQVSAAHVYLTYPFVLSWSMLEAMSAGCLLLGSATGPVEEVLRHGENGLLVDFFDHDALACQLAEVLANPAKYVHLRQRARQTVVENYDLKAVCLPQMFRLLDA